MSSESNFPEQGFRRPSDLERQLLNILLSPDFPGKMALTEQAMTPSVRKIDDNGSLAFAPSEVRRASVIRRIPVEAELDDQDSVTIHVLLHVVDGLLNELEVYRDDSGRIRRALTPDDLRLMVL
jgi:hypothetical protein